MSVPYHIQRTLRPHQIRLHSVWCRHKPEIETDTGLGSYKQTPYSVRTGGLRVNKATHNDFFQHCTSAQAFQVYFKQSLNIASPLLHYRFVKFKPLWHSRFWVLFGTICFTTHRALFWAMESSIRGNILKLLLPFLNTNGSNPFPCQTVIAQLAFTA